MKNKKFYLILTCMFIIFLFSSSVMASENININSTRQVNLNNQNTDIESLSVTHIVNESSRNQMNNPTIQKAIDSAKSGDTIEITGNEYEHCHFVVNKKLTIISNVGTTMSPCPSNTQGSNGIGIFYITPEASGTILSGFTLINEEYKSGSQDPYCIYINNANDVIITNCTITKTMFGSGIFVNNAKNTEIINSSVKNSQKGIYLENCENTLIKNNNIISNNNAGIYVGMNSINLNICENIINANNFYGIYLGSISKTNIYSNKITENRDNPIAQRADKGAGIFVDSNVEKLEIKGNLISKNGKYGIYDSYKFTNMKDQYTQIVDGNYFIGHSERGIYHADPNNQTTIVYVWSNYYSDELFCGGTSYEPGVLISNHERDLVMSPITEIKKGVYSVSFIRKDTNEIASSLSSVDVTFFLNKVGTSPFVENGDVYRISHVINGTAIADFRNETYLSSNNKIVAVGEGNGAITYVNVGSRPSQIFNVNDNNIPENETKIITSLMGNSLVKYYGNSNKYNITLLAEGKPLANKTVTVTINNMNYTRTTNEDGNASISINLRSGVYKIELFFKGDDVYESVKSNDFITIKSTIDSKNLTKYYRNESQYTVKVVNANGSIEINKNIIFNINGVLYERKTNDEGIAKLNINLNQGTYIITTINPTNNEETGNIITVLPIIVENKNLKKYFQNSSQFSVKLIDGTGKSAAGESIIFNINGVLYERKTNDEGIAKLNINLNQGTYIITSMANDFMVSNIIIVLPIIESENIVMRENDRVPFTAKLIDGAGKAIAGENIVFNINGVFYTKKTNDEGIASLTIRLNVGKYVITSMYKNFATSNTIEIQKANKKLNTFLTGSDLNMSYGSESFYTVVLRNENNNPIEKQNINIKINETFYNIITNSEGEAKLKIDLKPGVYTSTAKYNGNNLYAESLEISNRITIYSLNLIGNATNEEIQKIIDNSKAKDIVKLTAGSYENISLTISNPIIFTSTNSILKGSENKNVINVNVDGAIINGMTIEANNGNGILVNGNDCEIVNCVVKNNIDSKLINEYNTGKITFQGNGIEINNGKNCTIKENKIYNFYNGIYLKNTKNNEIYQNIISKNNYGIQFGENVSETLIENNKINENIGLITMNVVEGPLGYGISLKHSGEKVNIFNNQIENNYMGIFIDAKNCTDIVISGNSIYNSTIEGITFNENYTYRKNAVQPIVENNTIYNNAKGPSMIILGEVSANPAGIYGPGEWNDSLKLYLGPNWYGTNKYTKWGNVTGVGTICPRISTTLITFNMTLIKPGKYNITFYNNGQLADKLPDFTVYFTLNFYKDKQIETKAIVHKGVATIEFSKENYYEMGNVIEASSGSLFDKTRQFPVIYTYNVPDSEIKK